MKYCRRPGLTLDELRMLDAGEDFRVSKESVERMNDYLFGNINKIVGVNDTLRILGDFCYGVKHNYLDVARQLRNRIRCKNIHFIYGNHDQFKIGSLFNSAYNLDHVVDNGQKIVLCHYAMVVWEGSHRGTWQLFGHSHSSLNPWLEQYMPKAKMLDVGVDNAFKILGEYRPFSFDEVKEYMNKKSGHALDHHTGMENPT